MIMAFDGIAVSVIAQELNESLTNARFMKVFQIDRHTIVLHLRTQGATRKLVISADPVYPRIHTTEQDYPNPLTPPAFCMLLRKHLEPSRILSIKQLDLERIITITFEVFDQDIGRTENYLIFELMGRHSNIILLDHKHIILDAIHRSSNEDRSRQLMPNIEYQAPANQGKLDPTTQTKEDFIDEMRLLPANISLTKGLMQLYQGLGPQTATEIVRRANLDPNQVKQDASVADFADLWHGLQNLLEDSGNPVIAKINGKTDFFAYPLTEISNQEQFYSLDTLLDNFYSLRINRERIRSQASVLTKALTTHLKRVERKEKRQRETLIKAKKADKWQKYGELILANIYNITKGMDRIDVTDYYDPKQPTITIPLDSSISASDNAQAYFKKYTKAKNSVKVTKLQLQKTLAERRYIDETMFHIEEADSIETLVEIKEELINTGYLKIKQNKKTHRKQQGAPAYTHYLSSDGVSILLGRNNKQNDILTFKVARPNDIWLHAQKIPGSHVIVKVEGEISEQTMLEAATLAAYFSKSKASSKVPVDYTERKHVRKPSGAKPGLVTYNTFSTIVVDPTNENNLPKKKI